ncbi:hypothetical protein BY996DRAFT_6546378 [Phakopsora pachyrhizi]|nr:hypothetical protein BY996DRAFT_6546378 [Phakopsora pachyrhizi]
MPLHTDSRSSRYVTLVYGFLTFINSNKRPQAAGLWKFKLKASRNTYHQHPSSSSSSSHLQGGFCAALNYANVSAIDLDSSSEGEGKKG